MEKENTTNDSVPPSPLKAPMKRVAATVLLAILTIEAVVVIVLESLVVQAHITHMATCALSMTSLGTAQVDLIYHGLVIAAQIYQILLCVDCLWQRNTAQLYCLLLFGLLTVVFAGIQTNQHLAQETGRCPMGDEGSQAPYRIRVLEYTIVGFMPAAYLVFAACATRVHRYFAWYNYLHYSSDIKIRNALVCFSTLVGMLKLDFYFVFSYATQLAPAQLLAYPVLALESILVFGLGSLLFILAWYAVTTERVVALALVVLSMVSSLAYFVFRLISFSMVPPPEEVDPYKMTRYYLVFTTLVVILLLILTVCVSIICIRNMMQGIRVLHAFHCRCELELPKHDGRSIDGSSLPVNREKDAMDDDDHVTLDKDDDSIRQKTPSMALALVDTTNTSFKSVRSRHMPEH